MSDLDVDLNKTIAAAVNAKIEAALLASLSGDEVLGGYITAALQQEVQIGDTYNRKRTTFLHAVLMKAMQDAVQVAVTRLLSEEMETIEEEIRKGLKREAPALAKRFIDNLGEAAAKTYGVKVDLVFPNNY